jgi:hypothetical protein
MAHPIIFSADLVSAVIPHVVVDVVVDILSTHSKNNDNRYSAEQYSAVKRKRWREREG